MTRPLAVCAAAVAVAALAAGCGSSSGNSTNPASPTAGVRVPGPPGDGTGLHTEDSKFGRILVDGTASRDDSTQQVTCNGHPLYRYSLDGKKGDINGQGLNTFGGTWYVVNPSGDPVTTAPVSSGGW